jgi:hypothetical protein
VLTARGHALPLMAAFLADRYFVRNRTRWGDLPGAASYVTDACFSSEPCRSGSVRSLLPADAAHEAEPKAHPNAGPEKDDPRNDVIDQGYQIQDIDRQVNMIILQASIGIAPAILRVAPRVASPDRAAPAAVQSRDRTAPTDSEAAKPVQRFV